MNEGEREMSSTEKKNYINPNDVPKRKLYNGIEMPCIGMGTFGSDRFTPDQVANAVAGAIDVRITSYNVCYTKLLRCRSRFPMKM